MLEQLLDSRTNLALAIGLLSAINYFVARLALIQQTRQNFVEYGNQGVDGRRESAASDRAQLAKPFIMTAIIVAFTLIADRFTRELVGGGWFVMQIGSLGFTTADVLAMKALQKPDAAHGRIRYSVEYRRRLAAARSVGMAIVAAAVALLFSSWAFLMGALLLLATGVGWYRRARQANSGNQSV
jgi:hypothetical protein